MPHTLTAIGSVKMNNISTRYFWQETRLTSRHYFSWRTTSSRREAQTATVPWRCFLRWEVKADPGRASGARGTRFLITADDLSALLAICGHRRWPIASNIDIQGPLIAKPQGWEEGKHWASNSQDKRLQLQQIMQKSTLQISKMQAHVRLRSHCLPNGVYWHLRIPGIPTSPAHRARHFSSRLPHDHKRILNSRIKASQQNDTENSAARSLERSVDQYDNTIIKLMMHEGCSLDGLAS